MAITRHIANSNRDGSVSLNDLDVLHFVAVGTGI